MTTLPTAAPPSPPSLTGLNITSIVRGVLFAIGGALATHGAPTSITDFIMSAQGLGVAMMVLAGVWAIVKNNTQVKHFLAALGYNY